MTSQLIAMGGDYDPRRQHLTKLDEEMLLSTLDAQLVAMSETLDALTQLVSGAEALPLSPRKRQDYFRQITIIRNYLHASVQATRYEMGGKQQ